MKALCWTVLFTSLGCWQMLAGDLLWENLTEHKLDAVSVTYLSDSITNRTGLSADFLKQHYTHFFAERAPEKPDSFYKSLKTLLSSSQPLGPIKPANIGEFRWCITMTSSDSAANSTTEIYVSRGRKQNVARIGSEFYKLDDMAAKQFFDQFGKLFGF